MSTAKFPPFGEVPEEDLELYRDALSSMGVNASITLGNMAYLLESRGRELSDEADGVDLSDFAVVNDPRYEEAVKSEYESLEVLLRATVAYHKQREATFGIRRSIQSEVAAMAISLRDVMTEGEQDDLPPQFE